MIILKGSLGDQPYLSHVPRILSTTLVSGDSKTFAYGGKHLQILLGLTTVKYK